MRWRLLLEEYEITWKHIKGKENLIADMLSRYPKLDESAEDSKVKEQLYTLTTKENEETFPLNLQFLAKSQEEEFKSKTRHKQWSK